MIAFELLAIAGIILAFCSFILLLLTDEEALGYLTIAGFCILTLSLLCIAIANNFYNKGQIDALKGDLKYEILYAYPPGDTIPSDTLYLKIKEHETR